MRGKREDTYSVRLPAGFPHVGSSVVREMLAVLFAQKVPLVGDPGSGEEYLKLTLPCAQVHALQPLAGGDPAGVALRRLVATFVGSSLRAQRPVRALPPAVLSSPENGQTVASGKPRPRSSSEPPPWYGLGAEQWAHEGPAAKRYVREMARLAATPPDTARKQQPKSMLASAKAAFLDPGVLGLLLSFVAILLCAWAFGSGGTSSAGAGSQPAVPPFSRWRPQ
jgi:hypothetical protein